MIEKKLKNALRDHRNKQEKRIVASDDSTRLQKFIKTRMRSTVGIPPLLDNFNRPVFDLTRKCDLFSSFFGNIHTIDSSELGDIFPKCNERECNIDFSPHIVYTYLLKLPNKTTYSPEGDLTAYQVTAGKLNFEKQVSK